MPMNDIKQPHQASDDQLEFDDDVPHVIASRYKLARHIALIYGAESDLYQVDGLPEHLKWLVIVHIGEVSLSVPIPALQAGDFWEGIRSMHILLELIAKRGISLAQALRPGDDMGPPN
jgi:hypothetical protein